MPPPPAATVVIPSHARAAQLARTLRALASQTLPGDRYEVIVVLDGGGDGVPLPGASFACRLLRQPHRGSGAARNRGAREARAPILVFLDDDMEAAPSLLEQHLAAQRETPGLVLGAFSTPLPADAPLVARAVADWWTAEQAARLRADYVPSHRDCWSGNMSLPRALFEAVGGFDEAFGRHASGTDVELGARLLACGVHVRYVPEAAAVHHERATHGGIRRRAVAGGVGHVLLGRRHPDLLPSLPLSRLPVHRGAGLAAAVRWRWPRAAERVVAPGWWLLACLDRAGRVGAWRRLSARLQHHAYWCGVAREVGGHTGWKALVALQAGHPPTGGAPTPASAHRDPAGAESRTAPVTDPWPPGSLPAEGVPRPPGA